MGKQIKIGDVSKLASGKQSTSASANNFREKIFKSEYSSLIKHYHDNTYKMIDENMKAYKKRVLNSQSPEIALAYIMATQVPLISYLELRALKDGNRIMKYPERLYENSDYAPFEEVIIKNENYNQTRHVMTCIGTNVVNMGVATFVKGINIGKSEEEIRLDLTKMFEERRQKELEIVGLASYPSMEMLEKNFEKVKMQIEDAISEIKDANFLGQLGEEK